MLAPLKKFIPKFVNTITNVTVLIKFRSTITFVMLKRGSEYCKSGAWYPTVGCYG
jgi:hypothetical protein